MKSFWDRMRLAAEAVRCLPAWCKAGISLSEKHYVTFCPEDKP